MKLGDILAEHFRLKAQLVRLKFGTVIVTIWAISAFITLVRSIILMVVILKAIDAPSWVWWIFWVWLPIAIIVDQVETVASKGNS